MRLAPAVPVLLALLATACADLSTAPSGAPAPAAADFAAELRCTVTVASGALRCGQGDEAAHRGPRRTLIIGGQHVYVRVIGTGASFTPADSTFRIDVSVQNLMAQVFGSPDGETDTGLQIFFEHGPTASRGAGEVQVHNEDGQAIFTAGPTPYFNYTGLLFTGDTSDVKTWEFKVDPDVEAFVFGVYVQGQLPHEPSLLRFSPSHVNEEALYLGLWGASASEVFAVGAGGSLARYTGDGWTDDESPTFEHLWDVWGSSAADVFAVGDAGTIVHWDGTAWDTMTSGLECTCQALNGVWGSAANDVWAVADGGVILHYDGAAWTAGDTVPTPALNAVWGSGPNDVFAAGEEGALFHYDGTGWTAMTSGWEGSGDFFTSVFGFSATSVYAAGTGGVLRWDGTEWSALEGHDGCAVYGMWGSADDDLFLAQGCGIVHWDGGTWAYMDPGGFVSELWGSGPLELFANTDGYVFRGTR
jgi:hypothetical protein